MLRRLRWYTETILRRSMGWIFRLRPSLHVVGDSHAKFLFGGTPVFRLHYLGPVTMHRIARDGRSALLLSDLRIHDRDVVVWCLGEIDIRCHVIPQADRQNASVESIVRSLAERYLQSIAAIQRDAHGLRTVVLSVIPPTNQANNEEYPIAGSLTARIAARRLLNRALEEGCRVRGFLFLDPFESFENTEGALREDMSDGNVHCGPTCAPIVVRRVNAECAPWLAGERPGG
jgi:lysophospholipase L1-like esterase